MNLRWKSSNVVKFYNKRSTAEQWIKEGKYALNWTRLSCHDFVDNQVRVQLFALAYNLGHFLKRLALSKRARDWSLRTLREKLVKIGACKMLLQSQNSRKLLLTHKIIRSILLIRIYVDVVTWYSPKKS